MAIVIKPNRAVNKGNYTIAYHSTSETLLGYLYLLRGRARIGIDVKSQKTKNGLMKHERYNSNYQLRIKNKAQTVKMVERV